jgi:hypothetical protein
VFFCDKFGQFDAIWVGGCLGAVSTQLPEHHFFGYLFFVFVTGIFSITYRPYLKASLLSPTHPFFYLLADPNPCLSAFPPEVSAFLNLY